MFRAKQLCQRQIKLLIAHRHPMLYINQVLENEVGRYVIAESNQAVSSGLGQLEAMGQAAAILLRNDPMYSVYRYPVFASMSNVEWFDEPKKEVREVRVIARYSESKRKRERFGFVDARAVADEKYELCRAELCFSFIPNEE